jgi:hypothetical protein
MEVVSSRSTDSASSRSPSSMISSSAADERSASASEGSQSPKSKSFYNASFVTETALAEADPVPQSMQSVDVDALVGDCGLSLAFGTTCADAHSRRFSI